ncbi:MAG: amino acid ABC transporter substrate-binding protein [Kiloniellales bacterium]|nr:amino acid ABC transporter substrate-binding protein [Kiloniellales bacterium]
MLRPVIMIAVFLTAVAAPEPLFARGTLERVQEEGLLRCGVIRSGIGVSDIDESGVWRGFFPDLCRAVAAAVTGDSEAVDFIEVNYVTRFEALLDDAFDVLMTNTTWTASRDTELGLAFTQPVFYDGQGFLAHRSLGATRLDELEAATVCVSEATTTIQTLEELIERRYPNLEPRPYESIETVYDSFFARECDLMTQGRVALVSQHYSFAADPEQFVLFPDVVSKEPLGPVVRAGEEDWFDAIQWTVFATIIAEEHGINAQNVDVFRSSANPEVKRLLGIEGAMGAKIGIREDWAFQVIRQVGSYDEIFARNLGMDSPIGLERGRNALWSVGGLIYAPPLR